MPPITLHHFSLDVPPDVVERLEQCLSPEEKDRANRALIPAVRRRFLVGRAMTRHLLAKVLEVDPGELVFRQGAWGKPWLIGPGTGSAPVHFNVSHSLDEGLLAIHHQPVGVDIESLNRKITEDAIAGQVMSNPDLVRWHLVPKVLRVLELLKCWSSKEAILKLLGIGMSGSMRALTLPIPLPNHPLQVAIPAAFMEKARFEGADFEEALKGVDNAEDGRVRYVHLVPLRLQAEVVAFVATFEPATVSYVECNDIGRGG